MQIFLLTLVMFALLMAGMAVGVIFSNRELKGSCGGSGGDDCFCERNNLPRACEQIGQSIPTECADPEHNHNHTAASVKLTNQGLVIGD